MARHTGNITTDHATIRKWAEERDARPACVKGTGGNGDPGMIRLDFPGYSGADSLQPITWDEWFRSFDDNELALVYQDRTAKGQQSNFNKLIGRDTATAREHGNNHASRHHGTRKKTASRTRSTGRAKSSSGRSRTASASGTGSRSRSTGGTTHGTRGTTRGTRSAKHATTRGTSTRSSRASTARKSGASTRGTSTRRSGTSARGGSRSRSSTRSSARGASTRGTRGSSRSGSRRSSARSR